MDNAIIENARLIYKNFSGKKGEFNPEGQRNFCILLDDDIAKQMEKDGWTIKYLKPLEEGDSPRPMIKVKIRFDNRPPKIVIVSSRGKSQIGEEEVNMLDWAEMKTVDVNLNPYEWERNGSSGVTAYLKSLYAVIESDPLEEKYEINTDSANGCIGGCGNCAICDNDGPCQDD